MIKLQDFAKQQGVTDRAIQKHLKTYAEELEGLYQRKGPNGTWLTDEACEILRGKMKQAPIVVSDASEELNNLRLENKRLLQALNVAKDRIIDLQEENKAFALKTAKIALLEAENERERLKVEEAAKNAQKASQELLEAQKRIAELENRKWYELIFKKKEK